MGHKAKRVQFWDSQLPITEMPVSVILMGMGIFLLCPDNERGVMKLQNSRRPSTILDLIIEIVVGDATE